MQVAGAIKLPIQSHQFPASWCIVDLLKMHYIMTGGKDISGHTTGSVRAANE